MAFNPLHTFRKRQKTGLAILAILCMFLFILQFGKGDVFERFGIGRGRKDEIVLKQPDDENFLMNGKKVTSSDLYQLSHERLLAATYLVAAYGTATARVESDLNKLQDDMKKGGGFDTEWFKKFQELNNQKQKIQSWSERYETLQFLFQFYPGKILLDELLDFMIWREEAKRLGLYISNEDIDKLIKDSTDDLADLSKAQGFVSNNRKLSSADRPVTVSQVYDAVRGELCVQQAQKLILGEDRFAQRAQNLTLGSLDPMTPSERYEAFRKNRTSNFVALLTLPVKDFLAKVESLKPDEDELKKLFDLYKNKEYSPDRSRPAFMEPRRVSLEWVSGSADSPHYRDLADLSLLLSTLTSSPESPLGNVYIAELIGSEYKRQTVDKYHQFGDVVKNESPFQMTPLTDPNFALSYYTGLNQPENVVSVLGLRAMDYPLPGPLPAAVSYQSCPVARDQERQKHFVTREAEKRAMIGGGLVLSSLDSNPFAGPAYWAGVASQRQYLPLDVVAKQLLREVEAKIARVLLVDNLLKFKKELEAKRFKPTEAREWLDKAVIEYGLTKHVIVSKPLGRYEVAGDPEMTPFKETYLRQRKSDDPKAEQFGAMFFEDRAGKTSAFAPKEWPDGFFDPANKDRFADVDPILYWKTKEDEMPQVPTFEAARSKVEEAWRFQKARALAKKEADELQAKARESGGDQQTLKDLAAQYHANYSELGGVARFVVQEGGGGVAGKSYKRYESPKDGIPNTDEQSLNKIREQLFDLKNKGDTVVFANQPENQFYVATLYLRSEQNLSDFYPVYRDSTRTGALKDHLFDELDMEKRGKLLQERIKQLRAKAAPVNDDGSYRIDSDQRADLEKRLKPSN